MKINGKGTYQFRVGVLILTVLAGAGCASKYDKLVKRARLAESQGDSLTAALSYRYACARAERRDDAACAAAARHARIATRHALARAAPRCRAGDYAACDHALAPVGELDPGNASAARLRAQAGEVHAARCADARDGDSASELAGEAECLRRAESAVARMSYSMLVGVAQRRAAAAFYELSRDPAVARYPGARMLVLDAALAHVDNADVWSLFEEATTQFVEAAVRPAQASLAAHGPGTPTAAESVCQSLDLGPRVRCVGAQDDRSSLVFAGTLRMAPFQVETTSEQHSARYESGIHRYPNPAYDVAQRRADEAARSVHELEPELLNAEFACKAAQEELRLAYGRGADQYEKARERETRICERYQGIQELHDRRVFERDEARRYAEEVPAFVEEPAFDVHHWTSQHYVWTAPFAYTVRAGDAVRESDDVIRVTGWEQPGFAPAGVPASRIEREPTAQSLYAEARLRALAALRTFADESLRKLADDRRRDCARPIQWTGPWLQCWAEAMLWAGEAPRAAGLLGLAGAAPSRAD